MSDKEPPNPFEEIQRQLNELFKDSNIKVSTHTFNESDIFDDAGVPDGGEASLHKAVSATDPLEKIRQFHLKPKEIRDYLNRRFGLSYGSLTPQESVKILTSQGVGADTAAALQNIMLQLENAEYTGKGMEAVDSNSDLVPLIKRIEKESR